MDKFTETRQRLGKALYEIMKKSSTSGHVSFGAYDFFAEGNGEPDQYYVYSMGWRKNGMGIMAIRKRWNKMEDAVSDVTTIEDMEQCLALIPEAAAYMEQEQKRFESSGE